MQKKKGISLIVLVITIIVMIVLAGAIILSLNNAGIIEKSNEAVDLTNLANVREFAQTKWVEAYLETDKTQQALEDYVLTGLTEAGIKIEDFEIKVTTSGVTVINKSDILVQEGLKVVKSDQVLEIGDTVNYDAGVSSYTSGWKVLGADTDGNLLIMSAGDVDTLEIGEAEKMEKTIKEYEAAISSLNSVCELYGKGKGAVGSARSITVEDINKVSGYNPETAKYGEGTIGEYGNIVTFKYNSTTGETTPQYTSNIVNGTLTNAHTDGFYYYNGEKIVHINDLATGTRGTEIIKLKSNYYNYSSYSEDLPAINKEKNEKIYTMFFGNQAIYWLANTSVHITNGITSFGLFSVNFLRRNWWRNNNSISWLCSRVSNLWR